MANTAVQFWDYQVWDFLIVLSVLFVALIIANLLRRIIKPLRQTLIPSSVLAGFLVLLGDFIYRRITGESFFSAVTLEALTYHGLGLGFVAMSLRSTKRVKTKERNRDIFNSGLTTVSGYLIQGVIGLAITIGLSYVLGNWSGSGILLPMGYGQGPGQAFNWGSTYQNSFGFENGSSFGLAVAAMGFVSASVGGIIYLARLKKKGRGITITGEGETEYVEPDAANKPGDIPMSESLDKLTVQFGLVFGTYLLGYGVMFLISWLCDISGIGLLINTVKPLIWGFNFLFGILAAIVVKAVMGGLQKKNVIKRNYLNNFMLNRVSGLLFDLMVVASIAVINLTAFTHKEFILPLTVICVVGCVATYLWMGFVSKKLYPTYADEQFLAFFGMLTGTLSTGVILLREVDPQYKTPASDNLVYQNLWAIVFGFPMLLLLGFIDGTLKMSYIVLGACALLFVIIILVLFRNQIFRRKNKQ